MGWDELRQSVAGCNACALCQGRKQAVLGVGDASAGWLFIGEGPGAAGGQAEREPGRQGDRTQARSHSPSAPFAPSLIHCRTLPMSALVQ